MLASVIAGSVTLRAATVAATVAALACATASNAACPKLVGKPLPTIDLFDASLRPVGNVKSDGWVGKPLGSEHPDAPAFIAIDYWGSIPDRLPAGRYFVRKAAVQPLANSSMTKSQAPRGGTGRDTNGAGTLCE